PLFGSALYGEPCRLARGVRPTLKGRSLPNKGAGRGRDIAAEVACKNPKDISLLVTPIQL
ncbi:MAG TPA: hypothetical protein VFT87_04145, partial [Candidatus Saccharimonadales bacterium]|nr:hypothetical protein [Candidatus Saccharimonadales bacterium]